MLATCFTKKGHLLLGRQEVSGTMNPRVDNFVWKLKVVSFFLYFVTLQNAVPWTHTNVLALSNPNGLGFVLFFVIWVAGLICLWSTSRFIFLLLSHFCYFTSVLWFSFNVCLRLTSVRDCHIFQFQLTLCIMHIFVIC